MKKRTLLSFAAAATIGLAGVGSYAAWDNLNATSSGTMAVPARIDIEGTNMGALAVTTGTGNVPVFTGSAVFDLSSVTDTTGKTFELNVDVKNGGTAVSTSAYTVAITKGGTAVPEVGNVYTDATPGKTATETYSVVITLNDTAEGIALANTNLTVDINGKLK